MAEKWIPDEGNWGRNTIYTIKVNGENRKVTHYRSNPAEVNHKEFDLWYDQNNGHFYYKDADGQYQTIMGSDGKPMFSANRALIGASTPDSDEYDTAYERAQAQIAQAVTEKQEKQELEQRKQKEQAALENPSASQVSGGYVVNDPSASTSDASVSAAAEYEKRKNEANAQLQQLINSSVEPVTPLAKETQTVYYQYGQNQIDLKYYLHNIGTNLQGYLNSKGWTQAQKNAFMQAYNKYKEGLTEQLNSGTARFSTDDSGRLVDSDGILSGANDHIIIDKNGDLYENIDQILDGNLQKSAIDFSPNDEVANYFNTIGQAIVSAGKVKGDDNDEVKTFDLNNDGFLTYWTNKVNPAGGKVDIDPYLRLDPVGLDGKRSKENRTKYLMHELQNYANKVRSGTYNFEGTAFADKNEYLSKIQKAIDNLANGWDTTDPATLQAIGITQDFYSYFLTDQADPEITEEQQAAQKAEAEKNRKETATTDFIEQVNRKYDDFCANTNNYTPKNKIYYVASANYTPGSEAGDNNIVQQLEAWGCQGLNATDPQAMVTAKNTALGQVFRALMKALASGSKTVTMPNNQQYPIDDVLSKMAPSLTNTEIGLFTEDPGNPGTLIYNGDPDRDLATGSILCIKDGTVYYDKLYNHKQSAAWQALKAEFERQYAALGSSTTDKPKYSFDRDGGVLKMQSGGEVTTEESELSEDDAALLALAQAQAGGSEEATIQEEPAKKFSSPGEALASLITKDTRTQRIEKAKEKGMSFDRYNKKQRELNGAPTDLNPDNGILKTEDYLRIGSCVADIVSLVLDPVSGGIVNVGSTLTNAAADAMDDSVTGWETVKNLFANLGMDALALVPVFGDAAGMGAKLLKNVKKIVPIALKAMTAYGIIATLKNSGNVLESFKKVMSDEKLTVGDWQNIAQGLSACAGLSGAVKSGAAKRAAKNRARKTDEIGLGVTKKDADGKVIEDKDIILQGEHAEKIKAALADNDIAAVNAELKKIDDFKDYEVKTNYATHILEGHLPFGKNKNDDGSTSWGFRSPITTRKIIDSFEIYDKSALRSGIYTRTRLNTNRQDAALRNNNRYTSDELLTTEQKQALAQDPFNGAELDAARQASDRKRQIIASEEAVLNGTVDANGTVTSRGKIQELADADNNLRTAQDALNKAEADARSISNKHKGEARTVQLKTSKGTETFDLDVKNNRKQVESTAKKIAARAKKQQDKVDNKTKDLEALEVKQGRIQAEIRLLQAEKRANKSLSAEKTKQLNDLTAEYNTNKATKQQLKSELKVAQSDLKKLKALEDDLSTWGSDFDANLTLKDQLDHSLDGNLYDQVFAASEKQRAKQAEVDALRARIDAMQNTKTAATNDFLKKFGFASQDAAGNWIYDIPDSIKRKYGSHGNTVEIKNVKDIISSLNLLQSGGNVTHKKNISGVRMIKTDGWYRDIFSHLKSKILQMLSGSDAASNAQMLNTAQDNHYDIYHRAGGTKNADNWRRHAWEDVDQHKVADYQKWYQNQGFNDLAIQPNWEKRYGFGGKRTSGDSKEGGWKSDNYFSSITDDRRVLGRKGDWSEEELANFNEELKSKGFKLELNTTNDYYYLKPLNQSSVITTPTAPVATVTVVAPAEASVSTSNPVGTLIADPQLLDISAYAGGGDDDQNTNSNEFKYEGWLNRTKHLFPNWMDVLRYERNKANNIRNYKAYREKLRPIFYDPQRDYVLVHSGLNYENAGERSAGTYYNLGQQSFTSDADKWMAYQKELAMKGEEAKLQGYAKSDQLYRTTQEEDLEQRIKNHTSEHTTADKNRLSAYGIDQQKNKDDRAAKAVLNNDEANFILNDVVTPAKAYLQNIEAESLKKWYTDMKDAAYKDPIHNGVTLAADELAAWNKTLTGTTYTSLTPAEQTAWTNAKYKIDSSVNNNYYSALGLDTTKFNITPPSVSAAYATVLSNPSSSTTSTDGVTSQGLLTISKDGSKLEVAKLKAKIKDAERLQRIFEKSIERLDKQAALIAKSMPKTPDPPKRK